MTTQHALPLIGQVPAITRVPAHLISLCRCSGDAVLLAIRVGKKSQRQVANDIGMEPAQLSRIISGNAHMPADIALSFASAVKNWGWHQWVAHSCGMDLVPRTESTEERMFRLETENAELRLRAVA
ncbi:helix-turn-helix transcriptional regulator [Pseudoxanthomonas sp.]|uniref:helix-turn-helix domain-containing protein n=1 Tax=Pseudoxanthomonas sp. TaxID=1871049 RepID=UPI002610237E|nr:helix-turn-helix transcriptional regulator [Pseudoxanthomonas sp.]WDS36211.1 MAG: helix-turn-helix transcriptional regulator [Pseudoxanthomonas sp.]